MNAFIILIALIAAAIIYYNLRPSDEGQLVNPDADQSGGLYARYPWGGYPWWRRPWWGWRSWYPWRRWGRWGRRYPWGRRHWL